MSNQDNLNNVNELGRTIAALMAQPMPRSSSTTQVVDNLIVSLAVKTQELLNPVVITNAGGLDDLVIGTGDTAHIHGNGDVDLVVSGDITAEARAHASDCSTNNRGVPELLGPCDCKGPCIHDAYVATVDGPIRFESRDLVQYLSAAAKNGKIDHSIRCVSSGNGKAEFYIRPANGDGLTLQFVASTTNVA